MARRRKSGLDQAIEVAAMLPWKVSAALAPIAYLVLHVFAGRKPPVATSLDQMGGVVASSMLSTFCSIGQYLVPVILLIGAVVSFLEARKRRGRFQRTADIGQRSALLNMSWQDFEGLVAEYFKRKGFDVAINGKAGPDGGVDVELRKGGELSLVQCKQWRATTVGVDVVRELYGVMAARGAVGGYVVTSANFTSDAKAFADGRNIYLVDGEKLIGGMKGSSQQVIFPALDVPIQSPACPTCFSPMIRRVAKRGPNTGQAFWGCSRFPVCKGARDG